MVFFSLFFWFILIGASVLSERLYSPKSTIFIVTGGLSISYENIWAWIQAKGRVFKVISNPEDGTIEVRNEKGEIVLRKTNLSPRQVEYVEKRFKHIGVKRLINRNSLSSDDFFDPMIS